MNREVSIGLSPLFAICAIPVNPAEPQQNKYRWRKKANEDEGSEEERELGVGDERRVSEENKRSYIFNSVRPLNSHAIIDFFCRQSSISFQAAIIYIINHNREVSASQVSIHSFPADMVGWLFFFFFFSQVTRTV